jgi:hypothetical protein
MNSKGSRPHGRGMNTFDNGRAEARSRANRTLRHMTIGTAILGVVATGTLSWAAAATNDGSSGAATDAGATTPVTTLDTAVDTSTGQTIPDPAVTGSVPSVFGSTGAAQATTGGS